MSKGYFLNMRTTIRIDDVILTSAKRVALSRNISLTKLIEEALREKISTGQSKNRKQKVKIVTVNGNGLQPGIDIDDSALLLDIMDN